MDRTGEPAILLSFFVKLMSARGVGIGIGYPYPVPKGRYSYSEVERHFDRETLDVDRVNIE